jgi:hypothetical protein
MQMLRHVQAACQGPILRTHSYRLLMLLHYNALVAIGFPVSDVREALGNGAGGASAIWFTHLIG